MTITDKRLDEKYLATDGPAQVTVTYLHDTNLGHYKMILGGEISISEYGIQASDLTAAEAAFTEVMTMLIGKYPYTPP